MLIAHLLATNAARLAAVLAEFRRLRRGKGRKWRP